MNPFSVLARYYDKLSDDAYYERYLKFILAAIEKYSQIKVEDILDLACGTGQLSRRLNDCGFGMVCVDESIEMLNEARESCGQLLLINQSMCDFELYGSVQATICTLDSLNYLKNTAQLDKTFSNVAFYLEKGGLFIFDVNTLYRFEKVYGDKSFVFERKDGMLIWRNRFKKNGSHTIDLTIFEERSDGSYERYDERQEQKYFSPKLISRLLKKNGFETVEVYPSLNIFDTNVEPYDLSKANESEKLYYIARRI